MKNIDFKSILIGILGTSCFLLLIGQRADGNFGDIEVNSIRINDNGNGGHIQIYNPQGEATAYIGNHKENGGALMFYNRAGNIVSFLGTSLTEVSSEQYGELWIFNASGEGMTYIGTGTANNGVVQTFNQEGNETAYLGTGKNGWGGLILRDDQDEIYFFENGSSRLRLRPY